MTTRAVSTVADIALCILLIGAGVATVSTASPPPDRTGEPATPVATVLAATTDTTGSSASGRGTIAERIAGATLTDARNPSSDPTLGIVNETLADLGVNAQIIAIWRPYPGAPVDGRITTGKTPPPTAVVNTVRVTVPLASTVSTATALRVADSGGYTALAETLATATLERLRSPCTGRETVRTRRCTNPATPRIPPPVVDQLAHQFLGDLRTRYPTPAAAARDVLVDEVTVIVRRWTR